jgi:hypothetical protein
VIRIESHGRRLHITVRTNPDVERVSAEEIHHMADVESALRVVREFLSSFGTGRQEPSEK